MPSRSPTRIPLRKGTLSRFGYAIQAPLKTRRSAIKKAVKAESALAIFRKLNALAILNKNAHPGYSKLYLRDRNFVKREFMDLRRSKRRRSKSHRRRRK